MRDGSAADRVRGITGASFDGVSSGAAGREPVEATAGRGGPSRRSLLRGLALAAGGASLGGLGACVSRATTYVETPVTPTPARLLLAALPTATPEPVPTEPPPTPSPSPIPLPALSEAERSTPIRLFAGAVGPLHGPAFIARALNLWSDRYGLTVDFKYGDPAGLLQAVRGGHFEAALLPVGHVILLADKGQGIVVVAATAYGGHSVVVTPGIDGGARLRGKKYGAPARWDPLDVFFRQRVLPGKLELKADEMTLAPLAPEAAGEALKRGDVNAYLLPEPWATRAVESGARRLLDWRDLWADGAYHLECLAMHRGFVRERPAAARRLLWAHLDGLNYMGARAASTLQALSLTPNSPVDARGHREALTRVGVDQPRIPLEALKETIDDYRQSRLLGRGLAPDDVADYSLQTGYVYRPV